MISDYGLGIECQDVCADELFECTLLCDMNDSQCISNCLRAEAVCIDSKFIRWWFPISIISYESYIMTRIIIFYLCYVGSKLWTLICNIFTKDSLGCPCNANCPNGCDGCANLICRAVLVLSTFSPSNIPMVIGYNGKKTYCIFFTKSDEIIKVKLTMK